MKCVFCAHGVPHLVTDALASPHSLPEAPHSSQSMSPGLHSQSNLGSKPGFATEQLRDLGHVI